MKGVWPPRTPAAPDIAEGPSMGTGPAVGQAHAAPWSLLDQYNGDFKCQTREDAFEKSVIQV